MATASPATEELFDPSRWDRHIESPGMMLADFRGRAWVVWTVVRIAFVVAALVAAMYGTASPPTKGVDGPEASVAEAVSFAGD